MRSAAPIGEIKAALADPAHVCQLLGLDERAKRQSGGRLVHCPAHDDRKAPSCSVTRGPDGTLRVKCFGCGFSGDIYSLIAAVEGLDPQRDFLQVLARATALAGMASIGDAAPPIRPLAHMRSRPTAPAVTEVGFDAIACVILHMGALRPVAHAEEVTSYLEKRKLLDAARLDGWGALPPAEQQGSWLRVLREGCEACDGYDRPLFSQLDVESSGLFCGDRFAHPGNRLVIPWRTREGRVATLQRRRLDSGDPKYVFPAGRSPPLPYGTERLVDDGAPIAFVEGAVDVLALRATLGDEKVHVLGLPGLSGWRRDWAALAKGRLAAIAFDNDAAGERHVRAVADDLAAAGARRIQRWTPSKKDWAEA